MRHEFRLADDLARVGLEKLRHRRVVLHWEITGERYDLDLSAHRQRAGAKAAVHLVTGVRNRFGGPSPHPALVPHVGWYRINRDAASRHDAVESYVLFVQHRLPLRVERIERHRRRLERIYAQVR